MRESVLQSILPEQKLLDDESGWEAVLALVRDEQVCERLRGKWQREQGRLTAGHISVERWHDLDAEITKVQAPYLRQISCCSWPHLEKMCQVATAKFKLVSVELINSRCSRHTCHHCISCHADNFNPSWASEDQLAVSKLTSCPSA